MRKQFTSLVVVKNLALSRRGGRGRSGAAASWRVAAMSSPTKKALRIVFAWAVTVLVAISVYYGMLWLFGAHAARADWIQGSEPGGTRLHARCADHCIV
jgi:hypothetical protein